MRPESEWGQICIKERKGTKARISAQENMKENGKIIQKEERGTTLV